MSRCKNYWAVGPGQRWAARAESACSPSTPLAASVLMNTVVADNWGHKMCKWIKVEPRRCSAAFGDILDSQGVWLVKKTKETPGWSVHFPRWSDGRNTALLRPLTASCSSSIRYLQQQNDGEAQLWKPGGFELQQAEAWRDADLMQPLLAMTSAWLSLRTSPSLGQKPHQSLWFKRVHKNCF